MRCRKIYLNFDKIAVYESCRLRSLALFCLSPTFSFSQDSLGHQLDEYLGMAARFYQFNGSVLIAKGDSIILAKGYGWRDVRLGERNDANTIYQLGSLTKPFTAEVILFLVERGKLSLHDRLSKFFPDFPNGNRITIANLLDHTSGIPGFNVDESDTIAWSPVSRDTILAQFIRQPLEFKPGTEYRYSNSGYFLLGMIIEKLTGMSYEAAVREYIFNPLHMMRSGFDFIHLADEDKATGYAVFDATAQRPVHLIDSTVSYAAGAMYSSVFDLFHWSRSVARHEFLSARMWKIAQTPVKSNYGYGWIIDRIDGQKFVGHGGGIMGFTSFFAYFPAGNITIILLNNFFDESDPLTLPASGLVAILFHQPYHLPTAAVRWKVADSTLKKYVGTYYLSIVPKRKMVISIQDGHAVAQVSGTAIELEFESDTQFQFKNVPGASGEFILSAGTVKKIAVTQNGQYEWIKIH